MLIIAHMQIIRTIVSPRLQVLNFGHLFRSVIPSARAEVTPKRWSYNRMRRI